MRSKGHVSALFITSCFGVVYFKVESLFEKNIMMSISWEMISKDGCMTLA